MPSTKAATSSMRLQMPVGLGERSAAKVTFANTKNILVQAPKPAKARLIVGAIGGEGDSDPGVTGKRADGTTISFDATVNPVARVLRNTFRELPAAVILKTTHGGLGVMANVQPGEPATDPTIQVVAPRVDAVSAVVVRT